MKVSKIIWFCILLLLGVSSVNAVDTAPDPEDTLAYWTEDNTLLDSTDNNYDLTNNGAAYTSSGKINGAYSFDGTNDYMSYSTAIISQGIDFTVNAWVYPTGTHTTGDLITVLGQYSGGTAGRALFWLYYDGTKWQLNSQGGTGAFSGLGTGYFGNIPNNSWSYLTWDFDYSTGIWKGYVNNVEVYSVTVQTKNIEQTGFRLSDTTFHFEGTIDEVSIFDKILTSDERGYLYNSGSPGADQQYPYDSSSLEFENITINDETFLNDSYYNISVLNFNLDVLNTSTNTNINQTYYLYNSSDSLVKTSQYATNNQNGTFTLSGLDNDIYKIYFYAANNETNVTSLNYTFETNVSTSITTDFKQYYNTSTFISTISSTKDWSFMRGKIYIGTTSNQVGTDILYCIFSGTPCSIDTNYSKTIPQNTVFSNKQYRMDIWANNNTDSTSDNISIFFTVDLISPVINENIPLEIFNYSLTGILINVTDTNPNTCTIKWDSESPISCASFTSKTFTTSGFKNWTITAIDLAGNEKIESGVLAVNPFVTVRFKNNVTTTYIENYTTNIYHPDGTITSQTDVNGSIFISSINGGILDLGVYTLEFNKDGYDLTNNTITINETTGNANYTFNITTVTLFMQVFDIETLLPLVFDVRIENATLIKTFTNLTNISKDYQDVPTGIVNFRVSVDGYSDGLYINEFKSQTSLNFAVYLTPENNTDIVSFTVQDFSTKNIIPGVLIEAQRVINDSRITIQQVLTGDSGVGTFLINNLEDYVFVLSKDGYTQSLVPSIPGVNSYNVRLKSELETFIYLDGVNVGFFPQQQTINLNVSYNFTGVISGTSITQSVFTVYDQNGVILDTQTSTNPTGTSFLYPKTLSAADNVTTLYINITYIKNGNIITQSISYQVIGDLINEVSIAEQLGQQNDEESKLLRFFVILITYVITILAGTKLMGGSRDSVVALLLLPTIMFTFITWIPFLYGTVISMVIMVLYMGANKR